MAYACQMTDDRAPAERTLSAEQRRQLAVDLCNHVWMLLGTPGRSPQADDEMIHAALIGSPELPRPTPDAPPTLRVVGTTRAVVTRAGATAHVSVRFWVSEPARLQARVTPLRSRRAFALLPGTTFAGSRSTTTRPTATTTVPHSLPRHITKGPAQAQEGFLLSEQATPRKSDPVEPRKEGQLLPARSSATLG